MANERPTLDDIYEAGRRIGARLGPVTDAAVLARVSVLLRRGVERLEKQDNGKRLD